MTQRSEIQQLNALVASEKFLFSKLPDKCFMYFDPLLEYETHDIQAAAREAGGVLQKKLKDKVTRDHVDQFIQLATVDAHSELPPVFAKIQDQTDKITFDFLAAQYWLQSLRWLIHQPDLAYYALEFFISPELIKKFAQGDSLDRMDKTMIVDFPIALRVDKRGEFDLNSTISNEKKFHLLKSKFSNLVNLETVARLLKYELDNFTHWTFFVIGYQDELIALSNTITEAIFDHLNIFAYDQVVKGFKVSKAKANALSILQEATKSKKLDKIMIYRAENPISFGKFIKTQLDHLNAKGKLNKRLLTELYQHILLSSEKLILNNTFYVNHMFAIKLRAANKLEIEEERAEHVAILSPLTESGKVIEEISEYYKVALTQGSRQKLVSAATNNLKYMQFLE